MNTLFPVICSLIIFLFPFAGKFQYNRHTINSVVISLGLLGTFAGISYSLLRFDPENIAQSLPLFLAGMKTTILTIVSSVITSLLLKLFPGFYGIHIEKDILSGNLPETMQEMPGQLSTVREDVYQTEITKTSDSKILTNNPENPSSQDLSQFMDKQSELLKISRQEGQQLHERLEKLLLATEITNKNLAILLEKGIPNSNYKITAQVDELSELVKSTGEQVSDQIKQLNEKRAQEIQELMQFSQTLQNIIKKLNQSHNALYKMGEQQ